MRTSVSIMFALIALMTGAVRGASAQSPTPAVNRDSRGSMEQLRDGLAALRSLIACYRADHGGRAPTMEAMEEWRALLSTTTGDGRFTVNGMCGPYLLAAPWNPVAGSTVISASTAHAAADAGWIYDERTAALKAVIPPTAAAAVAGVLDTSDFVIGAAR